jgi:hypothetical protein
MRELGRDLTQAELGNMQVVDEDRPHILWNCDSVQNCIQEVHSKYWGRNVAIGKKEFLLGKNLATVEATVLFMLINMFIKYKVWKFKLAGVKPKARSIINEMNDWVNKLCAFKKWKNMLPHKRQHILQI